MTRKRMTSTGEPRVPFQYGRELDAGELVDRERELTEIAATIRNRGKLFLIGPRRYGKTSLLAVAAERARQAGVLVLRYDAERYETLDLLAQALLTGAARGLKGPLERVVGSVGKAAARLRPELSVAPDGSVTVALGVSGTDRGELVLLADALDAIERLAEEADRDVVVMLDEVQQVVVEHGLEAERQLRSTVQRHQRVAYVFAGSDTRLLTAMTSDPARPFYRLGARLFIGEIPREDFLEFLERGFASGRFRVEPGACERILERAEDVPYNVQRLAYACWESLRSGETASLSAAAVDRVLERVVRQEDPAYTQVWTSLSRNQKKALKLVIELGGERLFSADAGRRSGIGPSALQRALDALENRHLVRQEPAAGKSRYRLVDPFMAVWLELAQAL
ncbi:MAG TPA: ATP-binding protein [Longimicrobiales bacterium]|nr:ATP-binding protein [Longimicrobiales bacterium]